MIKGNQLSFEWFRIHLNCSYKISCLELTKYSDSTDGREDNSFRPPINDNSNTLDTVIIMISLIITGAEYRC